MLPNAWDVGSTRTVVDAGPPVVATAGNAIAAALGYDDGEGAPSHANGGLIDIDVRATYIAQMRAAADRIGVPLVINARIDTHLSLGGGLLAVLFCVWDTQPGSNRAAGRVRRRCARQSHTFELLQISM